MAFDIRLRRLWVYAPCASLVLIYALLALGVIGIKGYFRMFASAPHWPGSRTHVFERTADGDLIALGTRPSAEHVAITSFGSQSLEGADSLVVRIPTGGDLSMNPAPQPVISEESIDGLLPKRGGNGETSVELYRSHAYPLTPGKAKVALLINGLGRDPAYVYSALSRLPAQVSFGFVPINDRSLRLVERAREAGHEIVLSVPFSQADSALKDFTLDPSFDLSMNLQHLQRVMGSFTGYIGVLGVHGKGFTGNDLQLKKILTTLADRGVAFIDDGTFPEAELSMPVMHSALDHAKAGMVLDLKGKSAFVQAILRKIELYAQEEQSVLIVLDASDETLKAIEQWSTALPKGIELVPVSYMLTKR